MIDFFIELFNQYSKYDAIDIYLEIVAVIFGFLSVWYSKNNNILCLKLFLFVALFIRNFNISYWLISGIHLFLT